MIVPANSLLRDVEAFLRRSGMSARSFGEAARNDPAFVLKLRNGRSPSLRVAEETYRFMSRRERETVD